MAINRINETDLQNKLVSQLSNRPTDPHSAGGDNMTAQQVKARHDALGLLVKDKLNELLDALNNATVNGEPVTPLSDLITVVADGVSKSLTEWIEAKLTKSITAGEGEHAYGVDDDGEQTMLPVSASATAGAIPKYGTGGVLPVADGTEDGHAMNKGQVGALVTALADAIAAKYTKPDGGIPLADLASSVSAIISDALKWSNADASATPGKLVMRDLTGVAHGATYGASAIGTALVNKEQFEPVKALAEGANKAFSVASYSALATALNAATSTAYKVGQSIYVATEDVPDVWVYSVEESSVSYTYTTDSAFEASLVAGTLQIGYYTLRPLETEKVDFTGYATETYVGNAISGNIDADLDTTGKSADAKAVGDAIDALIDALVDGVMAVAEATYAESATYAQQADIANQINTDREIEDADVACPPVVFGTVGGAAEVQNGFMKFPEIRGNTIKWNQLWRLSDIPSDSALSNVDSYSVNGVTFSKNNDGSISIQTDENGATARTYVKIGSGSSAFARAISDGRHLVTGCPTGSASTYWIEYSNRVVYGNGYISEALGAGFNMWLTVESGVVITTPVKIYPQIFDLDAIFGATTAAYLTSLGVGVNKAGALRFKQLYPMPYYAYNAGTLLSSKSSSVDFVKRNQWDEEWEVGTINETTGENQTDSNEIRSKNYIDIFPSTAYFFKKTNYTSQVYWYDGNKNYIGNAYVNANTTFLSPSNANFMRFRGGNSYGATYNHDICIYINWDTPGLPYVPYSKQHIVLPNIELRSAGSAYDVLYQQRGGKRRIGTVDLGTLDWTYNVTNGVFYTSDLASYLPTVSGSVVANILSAKYITVKANDNALINGIDKSISQGYSFVPKGINIKDSAYTDAATFKAAMSGVMLYYELATETDITLEENPGWTEYAEIDNFGTVKFNQDPAQTVPVPQAYFVRYTVNLVEFLDSVGERAGFDASKIALLEDIVVPDAPTTDGSYTLKVTVSSGTPTYSWVADE